jgi:hypothetical protein
MVPAEQPHNLMEHTMSAQPTHPKNHDDADRPVEDEDGLRHEDVTGHVFIDPKGDLGRTDQIGLIRQDEMRAD